MDWTPAMQHWLEESCRASGVPLKVTDPHTLDTVATLLRVPSTRPNQGASVPKTETVSVDLRWAQELIAQGYHVEYVVKRTGVPISMIKNLVGSDGYRRARA